MILHRSYIVHKSAFQDIILYNALWEPVQLLWDTIYLLSFKYSHVIAFELSLSHDLTAMHLSTELISSSTYSTFSNFLKHTVLKRTCPFKILIVGFDDVEKNWLRTITYPSRKNSFVSYSVFSFDSPNTLLLASI